ncbi:MAG: AarF/UbiB family protein [Acidimicrobiales bacterium]
MTITSDSPADLSFGTFSSSPPWLVDPQQMPWRQGLDEVRERTRLTVPKLVQARKFPPLGRLIETGGRFGWAILRWRMGARRQGGSASRTDLSHRLRVSAEHLGPTYIKLAQIISAGEGVFPDELVEELKKCRDQVKPEPFDVVRATLERELGRPPEHVFDWISPTALAAASIAQVHEARLRTGEEVVVKVQRSTVGELVGKDLRTLAWLAPFLIGRIPVSALANPPALVELFAETITEELDFRLEAQNLLDIASTLRQLDQTDWVVPRPHPELVSPRMLVMEKVQGFAFDDVAGITDAGVDTHEVVRNVMIAFLESATLYGVFHGDFHGGNLFVQPDGKVALLDYGITGRMNEFKRRAFLRLMMGATSNDPRVQMEAMRDLGALPPDTDIDAVIADLGLDKPPVDPTKLSQEELLHEVQRVVKALLGYGARLPKELMLFTKNMIFLSSMIGRLAPDIDLIAEIQSIAMHFAMRHGAKLAVDSGIAVDPNMIDMTGVKASMGVESEVESMTWAELRARREIIIKRMGGR